VIAGEFPRGAARSKFFWNEAHRDWMGPFSPRTKELIGGFWLLQVKSKKRRLNGSTRSPAPFEGESGDRDSRFGQSVRGILISPARDLLSLLRTPRARSNRCGTSCRGKSAKRWIAMHFGWCNVVRKKKCAGDVDFWEASVRRESRGGNSGPFRQLLEVAQRIENANTRGYL